MKVSDVETHQPAPTSVLEAGAHIVSKGADVSTCPVDLTLTELRWASINIVHTQFPLSPPPNLVIENAYTTQLTALYFLGHVGSARC